MKKNHPVRSLIKDFRNPHHPLIECDMRRGRGPGAASCCAPTLSHPRPTPSRPNTVHHPYPSTQVTQLHSHPYYFEFRLQKKGLHILSVVLYLFCTVQRRKVTWKNTMGGLPSDSDSGMFVLRLASIHLRRIRQCK